MACIYDLVKHQQQVHHVGEDQTVFDAASEMVGWNVGAVAVLRNNELVGIFSERDIMKRVVVEGLDPRTTKVSQVMSANPLTVPAGESIEKCMVLMKEHSFRHLPICDNKKLVGMVSLRDLLLHDVSEKDHEVRSLRAYIHSTPDM